MGVIVLFMSFGATLAVGSGVAGEKLCLKSGVHEHVQG